MIFITNFVEYLVNNPVVGVLFSSILLYVLCLAFFNNKNNSDKNDSMESFQDKLNFSYLNESCGKVNPLINTDRKFAISPKYTYFGSPNPLLHQMKPMAAPEDSMFYFKDYKCSPECCPSPYSCSGGCVCIFPKNIYKCDNNPLI